MPLYPYVLSDLSDEDDDFQTAVGVEVRKLLNEFPAPRHGLVEAPDLPGFLRGEIRLPQSSKRPDDHVQDIYVPFNLAYHITEDSQLLSALASLALELTHHKEHAACISGSACFLNEKSEIADLDFSSYADADLPTTCKHIADWQQPDNVTCKSLEICSLGGNPACSYSEEGVGLVDWLLSNWQRLNSSGEAHAVMRSFQCNSVEPFGPVTGTTFTVKPDTADGESLLCHRYHEVLLSAPNAGFRNVSELRRYVAFLRKAMKEAQEVELPSSTTAFDVTADHIFGSLKGLKRAFALAVVLGLDREVLTREPIVELDELLKSSVAMQITRWKRNSLLAQPQGANASLNIERETSTAMSELAASWYELLADTSNAIEKFLERRAS